MRTTVDPICKTKKPPARTPFLPPCDFGCRRSVTLASQDDDTRNHPSACTLAGVRYFND